jgi:hypothetical protein
MTATAPKLLVRQEQSARVSIQEKAPKTAWRLFGWFGLVLTIVGFVDVALQWYPVSFRSREWEFATISTTFATLPLLTIGLTILLATFLTLGVRPGVMAMGSVFTLLGLGVVACYALFALDIPIALKFATGPAGLTIKKAIVRSLVMGACFGICYWASAVVSFRYLLRRIADG